MSSINFAGSYEDLIEKCRIVVIAMTSNLTELAAYNITADVVSNFSDEIDAFDLLPNDNLMESLQMTAIAARNKKAEEIRMALKPIAKRILAVYGKSSSKYNAVGGGAISRMNAEGLKNICEDTVACFAMIPAPLADEGLTAAMITAIGTLRTEIETAISAARAAVNNRSYAAEMKRRTANALYAKLVKYCSYGKEIWEDKNDANYADYVIYSPSSPPKTPTAAPTGLEVDTTTLALTWNAVAGATGYKVKYKFPADSGKYIDAHDGILHTTVCALAPQRASFKVVVLANNAAGLSVASEELLITPGVASPEGAGYSGAVFRKAAFVV